MGQPAHDQSDTGSPRFGMVIVGDELLSGRRQDKHLPKVIELLAERGLSLSWARILPDDREALTCALRETFESGDIVFCSGGIGATSDDQTRQAAAAALGVDLVLHPQARDAITLRCVEMAEQGQGSADMSTPENQRRLQMGMYPEGADIVPNTYNRIPGFHIRNHTFVPGFPVMAWPMLAWALDHHYKHLHRKNPLQELSFIAYNIPESRIAPALEIVEQRWPGVRAFSLPSVGEGTRGAHIELGVKGAANDIRAALEFLREQALTIGATLEPTISRTAGRVE